MKHTACTHIILLGVKKNVHSSLLECTTNFVLPQVRTNSGNSSPSLAYRNYCEVMKNISTAR